MSRRLHRPLGATLVLAGLAFNPAVIAAVTGRSSLSPRTLVIVLAAELMLVLLGVALAASGRWRGYAFHGIALSLPVVLVAGVELVLMVSPGLHAVEDMRHFASWRQWPAAMMRDDRFSQHQPFRLYRPAAGPVVAINSVGLRTAEPGPRQPGEWRIAITGGSTAWGWRVAEADTVAANLQRLFAANGHPNVRVFNFGIESAVLREEVAVLKAMGQRYGIDEVIFYTGGNDGWAMFSEWTGYRPRGRTGVMGFLTQLSTVRAALALAAPTPRLPGPPSEAVAPLFQAQVAGALAEAGDHCRAAGLVCDLVLQPWIHHKAPLHPREQALRDNSDRAFGPIAEFLGLHYREYSDHATVPVHDLRTALDGTDAPVFGDMIHVNEGGNAAIAEAIFRALRPGRAAAWTPP